MRNLLKVEKKLRAMGDAMKPVSAALLAGFTLSTKKAIDFESQMNTTKSLLADTIPTADELNSTTQKLGRVQKIGRNSMGFLLHLSMKGCKKLSRKVLMPIKQSKPCLLS